MHWDHNPRGYCDCPDCATDWKLRTGWTPPEWWPEDAATNERDRLERERERREADPHNIRI